MTTLFISDLHLDTTRPDITQAFYRFLQNTAKGIEALYILGDFFEAWIGDDENSELSREVFIQLKQLSDSGVKLFVMHGNRDFLIGQDFCQQAGATLINDPCVIDLNGEPTLLMHGDSLCTLDTDYMAFRQQARSEPWQAHFLSLSIEQRQALAAQLRAQSKEMNSNKSDDIMDVTASEVVKAMEEAGVTTFIHGHTHRPKIHELSVQGQPAKRWVLGDWDTDLWYIKAQNNTLELIKEPLL